MESSDIKANSRPNPYLSAKARNYALFVLTVGYCFNFIDRQLLSILQESIKEELLLSDGQLGLLTGFAFAMFYVTAGIPIARWADRGNRQPVRPAFRAMPSDSMRTPSQNTRHCRSGDGAVSG